MVRLVYVDDGVLFLQLEVYQLVTPIYFVVFIFKKTDHVTPHKGNRY